MLDQPHQNAPAGPALQRAQGAGRVAAKAREGRSVLDTLYQSGCAKIRTPRTHSGALEAVLINSSGGLTGGDRMDWTVRAGPRTTLVVTTQACERVYRSSGGAAHVQTGITIAKDAQLNWLPQETILFEGARLARTITVEMEATSRFLGLEAVLLGRQASGENAVSAALSDRWRVRRAGVLIHAEDNRLDPDCLVSRDNPALLDRARAFATLCFVSGEADRRIEPVKSLIDGHPNAGASRIGDKIVVRAMAESGYGLRKIVMPLIGLLSGDGTVPRLWSL